MTNATIDMLECGHAESPHSEITCGYGQDADGNRYCYACCADRERAAMVETGKATLYLTRESDQSGAMGSPRPTGYVVTDWPGTLRFTVTAMHTGRHNIAGSRVDAYFIGPDRHVWHATQIGDNQIARCKRTKQSV